MKHFIGLMILVGLSISGFAQTCTTFPCVVASVSLTNQTQALPLTSIFTPPASGIFRINTYLRTSNHIGSSAYWQVDFRWTDDDGATEGTTAAFAGSSNFNTSISVVQDIGGQPLLFRVTPHHGAGNKDGTTYNLFIVVEQLE